MALTRAQLLAGDGGQGIVLPGQVQAVKAGTGILIGADGTISVDGTTVTGVVRLNNITAYNNYIWPNATGTAGQFLQLGAANVLSWANSGVYVNSTQPASPVIGGLWYDCSTGTLKVYEACTTGTPQWTSASQSGLPVLPTNTAAAPAFVSGNGIIGDPYICNITTASAGTTVYVINTVTVTGLAPYQYVPIVDLNAVTNGGRFSFSNYYANSSGILVFQTIFTDQPTSPPATTFTAAIRVGNASAYIDATVNVVTAVSVTGGTIAGPAYSGNQLTYTAGVASGGTSPYTLTYQWYRDGVAIGSATGLTYTLVSGDVGKNITAKTFVTDAASQTASGTSNSIGPIAAAAATLTITSAGSIAPSSNVAVGAVLTYTTGTYTGGVPTVTASWVWKRAGVAITGTANAATYTTVTADAGQAITVTYTVTDSATPTPATANQTTTSVTPTTPFTPAVWTPTPSNGLDSNPGGQTGTYNGTSTSITTTGCVEASVNGGAYSTGTQAILSGQSLAIRWSSSGICGGAASGSTITGSVTDGTYTNSYSLALNRIPSPAIADITDSNVPLGGVTTKAIASPIAGLNSPAYVTYDVASTGTVISASTDNVTFTPLATSGTGFAVANSQTLYIRQTVGATPNTGYTAVIRVGDGTNTLGTYDEFTYTATTVLSAVLPTSVYNPTSGRPNATPSTTTYNDPTLGQLYGLVSAAWNGTQASTTLTPATGLLIGKNSGALGTSAITVTNSGTDTVQVAFDPTYIASLADSATASKAFTATYNSVNYTNTFSYTVDKLPVWTAPQTVTGVALSASVSTGALTVNAYNSPVVVSFANPSVASGATAMTAVSASVAGGAATPITLGTTTVTLSPGESLQVFGTVGASNNTKYGVQVTIGSSAAQDWYVTTTAVTPSITTPAITSPVNGTIDLNPSSNSPAGLTVSGDSYAPLNGAGTPQTSSTWEVYKDGLASTTQSTNSITAVADATPTIGSSYGGGYFGGQINDGGSIYDLIVAPRATGQYAGGGSGGTPTGVVYKTSQSADVPSATFQNEVYGYGATTAGNDAAHPAFQFARSLSIGGFSDWYIPAKNELEILYYNLKPNTTPNDTSGGTNPNAVPARPSNYTSGNPAQTTVTAYQTGGSEVFSIANGYWSSSESSLTTAAWGQGFSNGNQSYGLKDTNTEYARAIRRVAGVANGKILTISAASADGFALGQSVKGSVSNAVGIIAAIDSTSITVSVTSGTFQIGDFLKGNGTAITGSPFTVSASPFTSLFIPRAKLSVSTTYYARVKYATTNTTATTSSFSAWSSFATTSSFIPAAVPGTLYTVDSAGALTSYSPGNVINVGVGGGQRVRTIISGAEYTATSPGVMTATGRTGLVANAPTYNYGTVYLYTDGSVVYIEAGTSYPLTIPSGKTATFVATTGAVTDMVSVILSDGSQYVLSLDGSKTYGGITTGAPGIHWESIPYTLPGGEKIEQVCAYGGGGPTGASGYDALMIIMLSDAGKLYATGTPYVTAGLGGLGIPTTGTWSAPAQIGTDTNWAKINTLGANYGGYYGFSAVKTNGDLWAAATLNNNYNTNFSFAQIATGFITPIWCPYETSGVFVGVKTDGKYYYKSSVLTAASTFFQVNYAGSGVTANPIYNIGTLPNDINSGFTGNWILVP